MGLHAMKWAFSAPIKNAGAKFLLVALAEHARDDGEDGWTCFPSIKRLSKRTSQGERTIERHLSCLIANGWISRQIRQDRRRGESSYFYLLHRDKTVMDDDSTGEADAGDGSAELPPNRRRFFRRSGVDRPPISTVSTAKLAPRYIEEPVIEPVKEPNAREPQRRADGFEEFWAAFPSKIEERGARSAFQKLIRDGEASAETLVAGAKRYAASVRGQNPKFIKSPTSWLAKGCWADGQPSNNQLTSPALLVPAAEFAGPTDVWEAVATTKGVAWAVSYLAPCAWSGSLRALRPRTAFAARKLRDELGRLLRELSIAIIEPSAMTGVVHAC